MLPSDVTAPGEIVFATECDLDVLDRQLPMVGKTKVADPAGKPPDDGTQHQWQQTDDKLHHAEEQIHKILPHARQESSTIASHAFLFRRKRDDARWRLRES
jgi:hypothetical protein